jgi:ribosomal protein S18 acetylase RimI-like enzyme
VIRAATEADLPALVELVRRAETALFGAPEQDAAEITERIRRADPLAERSRLSHEDGRVLGAAWCSRTEAEVTVDPEADPGSVLGELVAWLEEVPAPPLAAADRDAALLALLQRRGWRVDHVSYELSRDVGRDWEIAAPSWPAGIEVSSPGEDELSAVHRLIFAEAGWAEIPGHNERPFEEWRRLFVDRVPASLLVIARRDGRAVGAALNRVFADGTGWVSQLAVARDSRGQGLGRSLLLESLRRLSAAGAARLGLEVQAGNEAALGLYRSVGLSVQREWRAYTPPAAEPPR